MPKRTDIDSILIIGAGPIIIGQACEFDYSGTQAVKTLKAEGYRVVLVNSNPATIMTDPGLADATYIEPITPETVARIIKRERSARPGEKLVVLPTMGGQTALNTAMALAADGTLDRLGIELIGAKREAIEKAEDRLKFREAMERIGLDCPRSRMVASLADAELAIEYVGLPAIVRPSFTLGGTGGGVAYNRDEFREIVTRGLRASPAGTALIEESVLGWKEFEMEVVRDRKDNCIIVCSIENVDPMGIHTGDSITVAPALTLTDKEYQIMRDASIACLREIGVDTGGSNVQFGVDPKSGRQVIIEMNPRVSRSSALASKATGFPIAKVAARLAVGYTLDEIQNDITGVTPASFEPTIDYVVTKVPRFTFEKFKGAEPLLTTAMKSVGEAMSIGRSFQESLQKALRSMETGLSGLDEIAVPGAVEGAPQGGGAERDAYRAALAKPTPDRLLHIAQAMRAGLSDEEIYAACKVDHWFLGQIRGIVRAEEEVRASGLLLDRDGWTRLKGMGFSDARLAKLAGTSESEVATRRRRAGVTPVYKRIDTCAAEFASQTPYMYSTYEAGDPPECEADPSDRQKVVILGGGPNRIGQGIEFDYCCVHAVYALGEAGYETIMVNCNPETVSTDYDTSDRLYFEPLTAEDVIELVRRESQRGTLKGVIVQYGGQTPLKLAKALEDAGIPILGTSRDAIDLAEDRQRFAQFVKKLGLKQPHSGTAASLEEAIAVAVEVSAASTIPEQPDGPFADAGAAQKPRVFSPIMLRPSYVLGGRAMEIIPADSEAQLKADVTRYATEAVRVSGETPLLIDQYLQDAVEVDVDCISDGKDVRVAGIMEHIEEAGIHSGDSACSLPPYSLPQAIVREIEVQTEKLARALNVVGLMNVQYAVKDGTVYVLEVNPRASRTVPFVAKATGTPVAKIAARVMAGEKLADFARSSAARNRHISVKEAVFPFNRFPGVDVLLGPEMKSTGEVMGIDTDFGRAFAKSQLAAGVKLPLAGTVFISVRDHDKAPMVAVARKLIEMGFKIVATRGTAEFLNAQGAAAAGINKVLEGRPHIVDAMKSGDVHLVFNTTEGALAIADSASIRQTALAGDIPYYTTVAGARAAVEAIAALRAGALEVAPLQSYFSASF